MVSRGHVGSRYVYMLALLVCCACTQQSVHTSMGYFLLASMLIGSSCSWSFCSSGAVALLECSGHFRNAGLLSLRHLLC